MPEIALTPPQPEAYDGEFIAPHSGGLMKQLGHDPNRPDDETYIVRLIGKVITVSLETLKISAALLSVICGSGRIGRCRPHNP